MAEKGRQPQPIGQSIQWATQGAKDLAKVGGIAVIMAAALLASTVHVVRSLY